MWLAAATGPAAISVLALSYRFTGFGPFYAMARVDCVQRRDDKRYQNSMAGLEHLGHRAPTNTRITITAFLAKTNHPNTSDKSYHKKTATNATTKTLRQTLPPAADSRKLTSS